MASTAGTPAATTCGAIPAKGIIRTAFCRLATHEQQAATLFHHQSQHWPVGAPGYRQFCLFDPFHLVVIVGQVQISRFVARRSVTDQMQDMVALVQFIDQPL